MLDPNNKKTTFKILCNFLVKFGKQLLWVACIEGNAQRKKRVTKEYD